MAGVVVVTGKSVVHDRGRQAHPVVVLSRRGEAWPHFTSNDSHEKPRNASMARPKDIASFSRT